VLGIWDAGLDGWNVVGKKVDGYVEVTLSEMGELRVEEKEGDLYRLLGGY
jgi:hypothetical protein